MKKIVLSLITFLLILVIAWSVYYNVSKNSVPADQDTTLENTELQPTVAPTSAVIPTLTLTPVPTKVPEEITGLFPAYKKTNDTMKYGYINGRGEFVIQPVYDYASDYYDGVAIVTEDDKYRVINETGDVIFTNDYLISPFYNGIAAFSAMVDDISVYGYIDTTGKVILEPQYRIAGNFNEEGNAYVLTADNEYALIDETGKVAQTFTLNKSYGSIYNLSDEYVIYANAETGKYGAVTVGGTTILDSIYSEITYLGHDLFAVKDPPLEFYDTFTAPSAIFNQKGEQLTDYSIYDVQVFNGDYSSATDSTSTYFLGLDGKEVTTLPRFEGKGSLTLVGDVIRAVLDHDLLYSKKDGTILWLNNNTTVLSSQITVTDVKFKSSKYVLVYYPKVEGLTDSTIQTQVNSKLKELFTDSRADLKDEDMLTVEDAFRAELINNLLVINKFGYDYSFGAAHGMPLSDYYYIDITTGKFFEFKDLFRDDSDYKAKLNEIINANIKELAESEDSMLFPISFVGVSDNQYFFISEDALTIYFYPYEIAAYAAGFPEFKIPFEDISEYIDTDGAFWKSFHTQ